jgi:hypothetical protein
MNTNHARTGSLGTGSQATGPALPGYGHAMLADAHIEELRRSAAGSRSARRAPARQHAGLRVATGRLLVHLGERLTDEHAHEAVAASR